MIEVFLRFFLSPFLLGSDEFHTSFSGDHQSPWPCEHPLHGGGVVCQQFIWDGRSTQDIDLVISASPAQLPSLLSFLPKTGYYFDVDTAVEAARRKSMFNVLDMARGWKIDFIFLNPTAYHQEAFSRRTAAEIALVPLFAATAEDVIVSKRNGLKWALLSGRSKML